MRNIPPVTKNLLIINVLAYLAGLVLQNTMGVRLNDLLGLHFFMASDFHLYQLVTYLFMHANFQHILFNMFGLWMLGGIVEQVWGPKKYLFYYIFCGMGAGVMQEIAQFTHFYITAQGVQGLGDFILLLANNATQLNAYTTVGASGSVFAILLAFGMLFPEERMFIFPLPVPIKAKWLVIGYTAIELFSSFSQPGDNVAHMAHIGGMLFGFFLIKYWRKQSGGGYYHDFRQGSSFFQNLKSKWEDKFAQSRPQENPSSFNDHAADWDYNARQRSKQEEIDRILDKIRKSGYDSLSKEEKQTLFDQSRE